MKKILPSNVSGGVKLGIVVSRFNDFITQRLEQGAVERWQELNYSLEDVTVVQVPGAVELPIAASSLTEACDVVICFGCVIRGETDHYDYVCQQASYGCQKVALETGVPVIFGVLTTENEEQALARSGGEKEHIGRSYLDAALETLSVVRQVKSL